MPNESKNLVNVEKIMEQIRLEVARRRGELGHNFEYVSAEHHQPDSGQSRDSGIGQRWIRKRSNQLEPIDWNHSHCRRYSHRRGWDGLSNAGPPIGGHAGRA